MDVALRLLARPATADAPNETENGELTKISTRPPAVAKPGGQILFLARLSFFEGTSKEDKRARNKI
jgi:hypothetical protein